MIRVLDGDMRDVVPTLDRIDCVVTDPPYELNFMGRAWDRSGIAFDPATWWPVFTALKPGGHLVAFGGSRTFHRMVCAIEDAGFEIRDTLMWLYGSGFPKSHNVAIGIDKALGAIGHRGKTFNTVGGTERTNGGDVFRSDHPDYVPFAPATPEAAQWQGWGTALKPSYEPIILARKPLDGTVAQNVLKHGVGGLNIDASRIEADEVRSAGGTRRSGGIMGASEPLGGWRSEPGVGRWPANVLHDGSDEVLEAFAVHGERTSGSRKAGTYGAAGSEVVYGERGEAEMPGLNGSTGSAARFFYTSKADKADRADSRHPTVKPVDLMRWLVRLVCPLGGTVLDPFAGSGSTGEAAMLESMNAILIEKDPASAKDIRHRIRRWSGEDCPLFAEEAD